MSGENNEIKNRIIFKDNARSMMKIIMELTKLRN